MAVRADETEWRRTVLTPLLAALLAGVVGGAIGAYGGVRSTAMHLDAAEEDRRAALAHDDRRVQADIELRRADRRAEVYADALVALGDVITRAGTVSDSRRGAERDDAVEDLRELLDRLDRHVAMAEVVGSEQARRRLGAAVDAVEQLVDAAEAGRDVFSAARRLDDRYAAFAQAARDDVD